MKKLTQSQRLRLDDLRQRDHFTQTMSGTNPSLCALEKRGLVKFTYVKSRTASDGMDWEWRITRAGRQCLALN